LKRLHPSEGGCRVAGSEQGAEGINCDNRPRAGKVKRRNERITRMVCARTGEPSGERGDCGTWEAVGRGSRGLREVWAGLGSLKAQFVEQRTKWDEANRQNMQKHESLRKQKPAPPPTQFPFTSNRHMQGKMPAGGVEITASSVRSSAPQNAANLGTSLWFCSDREPGVDHMGSARRNY
jgi:hypothetical protein